MRRDTIFLEESWQDFSRLLDETGCLIRTLRKLAHIVNFEPIIKLLRQFQVRADFTIGEDDCNDMVFEGSSTCGLCSIAFCAQDIVKHVDEFCFRRIAYGDDRREEHLW